MSIILSNLTMSGVSAGSTPPAPSGDPYWSSVSLLTETTGTNGQNNLSFVDSSTNNFAITNTNNGYTQGTFSPVAGGHSALAGGASTRLDMPNFSYADGDFTIEAWVYPTQTSVNRTIFAQSNATNLNTGVFRIEANNALTYTYYTSSSTGSAVAFQGGTISPNVWTHVAISRSGTTTKLFVNGVVVNTATIATMYQSASTSAVGSYATTNVSPFYGYLSDVRVTTTAVYTGNFSVPTAPLTAIIGTQLLLSFNNAGIYDAAAKNNLATINGGAYVTTAQKKFGTTSIELNGAGALMAYPVSNEFGFGTGDFTIEFWMRGATNAVPSGYLYAQNGAVSPYIRTTSGQLIYGVNGAGGDKITVGAVLTFNTWYYVAVSRSGASTKLFLNGTQIGSTYTASNNFSVPTQVALGSTTTPNNRFAGYIQDLRVTKGVARYTANFAAPTEPFPTN